MLKSGLGCRASICETPKHLTCMATPACAQVHRFDCRLIQRKPNTWRAHTRTLSSDIRQAHERVHSARVRGHAHSRAAVRFHGSPPQPRILQAIAGMHACLHARHSGTATDLPLMGADGWLQKYTFPAESRMSEMHGRGRVPPMCMPFSRRGTHGSTCATLACARCVLRGPPPERLW